MKNNNDYVKVHKHTILILWIVGIVAAIFLFNQYITELNNINQKHNIEEMEVLIDKKDREIAAHIEQIIELQKLVRYFLDNLSIAKAEIMKLQEAENQSGGV